MEQINKLIIIISLSLLVVIVLAIVFSHFNLRTKHYLIIPELRLSLKSTPYIMIKGSSVRDEKFPIGYFYGVKKGCFVEGEEGTDYGCELSTTEFDFQRDLYYYYLTFFKGIASGENRTYMWYLEHSTKTNKCEAGFKLCGKLDPINNLCVPIEEECPINDALLTINRIESGYETVNLTDTGYSEYYLNFKRNSNYPVIVGFNVSARNICAFNMNISSDYINNKMDYKYEITGCNISINDSFYDYSFTQVNKLPSVDSISYGYLLEHNNLDKFCYKFGRYRYNPYYEGFDEIQNLFARRYKGFDKECLKKYTELLDFPDYVEKAAEAALNRNKNALILMISGYSFLLCLFIISCANCCVGSDHYCDCWNGSDFDCDCDCISFVSFLCGCVGCKVKTLVIFPMMFFLVNFISTMVLFPYHLKFRIPECADDFTNEKIKLYNQDLGAKVTLFYVFDFIACFFMLLVSIFLILKMCDVKFIDCFGEAKKDDTVKIKEPENIKKPKDTDAYGEGTPGVTIPGSSDFGTIQKEMSTPSVFMTEMGEQKPIN